MKILNSLLILSLFTLAGGATAIGVDSINVLNDVVSRQTVADCNETMDDGHGNDVCLDYADDADDAGGLDALPIVKGGK